MSSSIKNRMTRLSKHSNEWGDVLALIRAKKRYSELTDDQKERYCLYYWGIAREVVEEVEMMVKCSEEIESWEDEKRWIEENKEKLLNFVLKKRPPKMSPEEERHHVGKVAKEIAEYIALPDDE